MTSSVVVCFDHALTNITEKCNWSCINPGLIAGLISAIKLAAVLYIYICSFITVWSILVILVLSTLFYQQPRLLIRVKNFDDRIAFITIFHHFFLHMRINAVTCTSDLNSDVTVVLNDIDFLQKFGNVGDLAKFFCWFWPHFTAHAQKCQVPSFRLQCCCWDHYNNNNNCRGC